MKRKMNLLFSGLLILAVPLFLGMMFPVGFWKQAPASQTEEVGYTTVGSSTETISSSYSHALAPFTAAHTGIIDKIYIYCSTSGATNLKVGIYTNVAGVPTALIANSPTAFSLGVVSIGWQELSPVNFAITAGTSYYIVVLPSNDVMTNKYNAVAGAHHYHAVGGYADAWHDPWVDDGSNNYCYSLKARVSY